jgi:hypothetical protein
VQRLVVSNFCWAVEMAVDISKRTGKILQHAGVFVQEIMSESAYIAWIRSSAMPSISVLKHLVLRSRNKNEVTTDRAAVSKSGERPGHSRGMLLSRTLNLRSTTVTLTVTLHQIQIRCRRLF